MKSKTIHSKLKMHCFLAVFQYMLFVSLLFTHFSICADSVLVFNITSQQPLNTENHDGFMDEVTREALRRIDYKLSINRLPAERGLRNANNGLIDGEMSRIKGLEKIYPNLVRVPEKIMDWGFYDFTKKKIDLKQGWASLNNKNVSFINGWKILEKNIPKSAAITKTRNSEQLFSLLKKDRSDYIVYERWGGNYMVKKFGIKNVSMIRPALAEKEMFIYLHKKHKALVPRLAQALVSMKNDGSYDRLAKKHLLPMTLKGNQ